MKVYVIYDEIYKEIISIHKHRELAKIKCKQKKEKDIKSYWDVTEYELEE